MNYQNKSFSVSVNMSQDAWDRIFGKKAAAADTVAEAPATPAGELPDLSARQCASCLERNALMWVDAGLIQCAICLARFPQGVEEARKVPPEQACESCGGTGKLRTSLIAFSCAACGGTGSKGT